jgi:hypothetical protein
VLRELGPSWVHALQLAHVLASLRRHHQQPAPEQRIDEDDDDGLVVQSFSRLSEWVTRESGLLAGPHGPAVWAVAPLVSAKDLLAALAPVRPLPAGKDLGRLLALALDWQLARHDSSSTNTSNTNSDTSRTECVAWVVAHHRSG